MNRSRFPILEYGKAVGEEVMEHVGRATARLQEATPLGADVLESEDEFVVVFDAPGATANDVQINYDEGRIEVRIERFRPFRDRFEMRIPGRGLTLRGHADLPADANVDETAARAELEGDGTLWIRLPKTDPPDDPVEG